jgi:uncharacterized protein
VVSTVNGVGVEVNTASKQLLSYVSGLNAAIAAAIVARRNEKGPFKSRAELKEVPRLGPKAFEQAAGFLRIRDADIRSTPAPSIPSAIPRRKMAADLGATVADLMRDGKLRAKIKLESYVSPRSACPRSPTSSANSPSPAATRASSSRPSAFSAGVNKPEDLKPGMKLPGIVTNVTAFGAFVDIGVHQDGLVHVSQLADCLREGSLRGREARQKVMVTVTEIDLARKRIALSMRSKPELGPGPRPAPAAPSAPQSLNGDWFTAALNKKK